MIENIAKIKFAFPSLPLEFYDVLSDRIKAQGFSDARLQDAVNHVIDTCHYPTPTIADFISFDKKFKVFTHEEMLKKLDDYGQDKKFWDSYKSIKLPNRPKRVWIHVNDIAQYNIPIND